ncbi:hypothetical protein GCM10020331_092270 [Ectobacillus funiculus]
MLKTHKRSVFSFRKFKIFILKTYTSSRFPKNKGVFIIIANVIISNTKPIKSIRFCRKSTPTSIS